MPPAADASHAATPCRMPCHALLPALFYMPFAASAMPCDADDAAATPFRCSPLSPRARYAILRFRCYVFMPPPLLINGAAATPLLRPYAISPIIASFAYAAADVATPTAMPRWSFSRFRAAFSH